MRKAAPPHAALRATFSRKREKGTRAPLLPGLDPGIAGEGWGEGDPRASAPVRDDLHVDVAASRVAIGADLLVRLFRQRLKLRLR